MIRKIHAIAILCVLVMLYFSGCISNNNGGGQQALDRDGDSYPDNVDDFPNDSTLHKKI